VELGSLTLDNIAVRFHYIRSTESSGDDDPQLFHYDILITEKTQLTCHGRNIALDETKSDANHVVQSRDIPDSLNLVAVVGEPATLIVHLQFELSTPTPVMATLIAVFMPTSKCNTSSLYTTSSGCIGSCSISVSVSDTREWLVLGCTLAKADPNTTYCCLEIKAIPLVCGTLNVPAITVSVVFTFSI
jgi:hypothetical protein